MRILFVGGGNMATALIGGLLQQGFAATELEVVDVAPESRARLERDFGVATSAAPDSTRVDAAGTVLLAVKPQQMHEVARSLAPLLRDQLVVTIAAGIRTSDLSRWLGGYRRIVRVMPNTPALIGKGVSGLWAPDEVTAVQREQAQQILGAVGETVWCAREEQLDAVTAVSASGPAYVFYFLEAMQRAASDLGFDTPTARLLAYRTFAGAVELALSSNESAATLRERVTSKGGTTEAALRALAAAGVDQAIATAIRAAEARARELGEQLGRDG
jgi:pyrroline-5-carboxylate reductase